MTKTDAEAGFIVWTDAYIQNLFQNYQTAGIPIEIANQMVSNTAEFQQLVTPQPTINHYFSENEKVLIGHYEYEVLAAPDIRMGWSAFIMLKKVYYCLQDISPKITPRFRIGFMGMTIHYSPISLHWYS